MSASAESATVNPASERYLAAIFILQEDGAQVVQARLAEMVGHAAPTVSEMVHRLEQAGYVRVDGRLLDLTEAGHEVAVKVVSKHRLAARLLTDVLGLPWDVAHAEADRWEHVISDEVADRLSQVLGNPTTCPHGCPIPGACATVEPTSRLAEAAVGQHVSLSRICGLAKFGADALAYLEGQHFVPGWEATVTARGPDGSLVLSVDDHTVVLGAETAEQLRVTLA
jgi:DtxR family transcriptional regulator, iron-dependent repressor